LTDAARSGTAQDMVVLTGLLYSALTLLRYPKGSNTDIAALLPYD
jgi:hypothetical protein